MSDPIVEARRWRDQAADDLQYARYSANGGFHAQACFVSQQVAEKALKAIHYARGARAVLGHSVVALLDALKPPAPELTALRSQAMDLDLFYIPTRYPNGLVSGTPAGAFGPTQSAHAISAAEAILAAVNKVLGLP
jgi:HEPN domain-containing protein